MSESGTKRKVPIKTDCQYLIRAKLYGVIALNSLEGMMRELDALIPMDIERDNVDVFAEELRRYQGGALHPTSQGDYLDRAVNSLAREIEVQIPVELSNSNTVKTLVTNIIQNSQGEERHQYIDLLQQPIEMIMKSHRFEMLVNQVCMFFYKKQYASLSEDTVNFIRRSIHELFRSKSKEQIHSQLISSQAMSTRSIDNIMPPYEYIDNGQFINASLGESERLMTNDMLQGLRQASDKEIEMMGQAAAMKHTDNIPILIVC